MKRPLGIHTLFDMYPPMTVLTNICGLHLRAVPRPYIGNVFERARAAWWVWRGKAVAVQWPKPGDLELVIDAISPKDWKAIKYDRKRSDAE